jgi:hypothetical protein
MRFLNQIYINIFLTGQTSEPAGWYKILDWIFKIEATKKVEEQNATKETAWDGVTSFLNNPTDWIGNAWNSIMSIVLWVCIIGVPLFLFFYTMVKSKKCLRISFYCVFIYIFIKVIGSALS